MHRSSRVVTFRFEMFLLFSRPPSSGRLHTKLHKFGWNPSLNNWTVLDFGEVDDIPMTYHIPDCSLHLLNDCYFCLWQRDSKNFLDFFGFENRLSHTFLSIPHPDMDSTVSGNSRRDGKCKKFIKISLKSQPIVFYLLSRPFTGFLPFIARETKSERSKTATKHEGGSTWAKNRSPNATNSPHTVALASSSLAIRAF